MKGYVVDDGGKSDRDEPWERLVTGAIGNAIEFWGFKRNHGRVWALLYIHNKPFSAMDIQEALGLSKGAVSMIIRELERWKVVHRVRVPSSSAWHFIAETDFMAMLARVISERETGIVVRTQADLSRAEKQMRAADDTPKDMVERVTRLNNIAKLVEQSLDVFLNSSHLDVMKILEILEKLKPFLERDDHE